MMKALVFAMCAALALVLGCSDEDSNCVNCPPQLPNPTLQNIWPNADKTAWTYEYLVREWGGQFTTYPTPEEVPSTPLPTWAEIHDLVNAHAPVEPYITIPGVYRMQFDGMTTTPFDITVQNLTVELFTEAAPGLVNEKATHGQPILREMSATGRFGAGGYEQIPLWPTLIHGGPWEKTPQWIGTYNDLEERLGWEFLTNDLTPGTEFTHQLIPQYADHIFLHCTVYEQTAVQTEVGTFDKALNCLYIIDYGISAFTDIYGQIVGYIRTFDYGSVIYVPSIGPVYSYERMGVEPGDPPTDGFVDMTLGLIGSSTLGD